MAIGNYSHSFPFSSQPALKGAAAGKRVGHCWWVKQGGKGAAVSHRENGNSLGKYFTQMSWLCLIYSQGKGGVGGGQRGEPGFINVHTKNLSTERLRGWLKPTYARKFKVKAETFSFNRYIVPKQSREGLAAQPLS